jgi:hypothetical protein
MTTENPFVVYSPEDITSEKFRDIFIKEHSWINALEIPKDFFIYGTRGSGKSMLLNYLEFSHQLCYFDNDLARFFQEDRRNKYMGIMVHIRRNSLDTDRYELLIKNDFDEMGFIKEICMNDLVMAILYKVLDTFIKTEAMAEFINSLNSEQVKEFCKEMTVELDKRHIHSVSFDRQQANTDMFRVLANIYKEERSKIRYYANDKFQMKDTVYKGNYSSFDYMHGFITRIKKLLNMEDFSFYILLDNGDETQKTMQLCIDFLISQREHRDVCFKVVVKNGVYWDKGDIQSPHDFSQIDIDELYSTQHTVYRDRIKGIATKRLKLAGIDTAVENFFPESETEKRLLQKIKTEIREESEKEYNNEYGNKPENERPTKSNYINNRISKYAQAKLFRGLKKTAKSYAGFDNMVHLSSGIVRQFLDISSYMFDEEIKRKGDENITQISLGTQNTVTRKYADDFMDELERKYKGFEKEENIEEARLYKDLYILIEALGKHYKERLMNPEYKEPRVFTFTLKDPHKDLEIEKILEIGVDGTGLTGTFFQTYWYSSKIGVGKYRGYAFNRRLCPRYVIDHTSFRGRIELSTADLRKGIEDGKMPKSTFHDEEEKKKNFNLDQFSGGE